MISFPATIQTVSKKTGIPERTLRYYCGNLHVPKFGHGYMITEEIFSQLIKRDAENQQYNRRNRKSKGFP